MSAEKDIVVVSFHEKVEAAIASGMDPRRFMELMMVDYLRSWAGEKGLVTISDGDTTIQCFVNNGGQNLIEWICMAASEEMPGSGENVLERLFIDYAREISTDGGKTAKIKGAIILIDQPLAQPKKKRQ